MNARPTDRNEPTVSKRPENSMGLLRLALIGALCGISTVAMADPAPAVREVDTALIHADREAVRLLQLLDETRRARNVSQIACVDRQLAQVNGFTRLLQFRRDRVEAAVSRGDTREVAHERRVVRQVEEDLRRVARAGLACVYPVAGQADRTVVEVTVSPDIRHQDIDPPAARP